MPKLAFHLISKTSFLTCVSRLQRIGPIQLSSLMPLILFFGLLFLATDAVAGEAQAAGVCPPGEAMVVTHPGDATVIRCRPEFDTPTIAAPSAPHQRAAISTRPRVVVKFVYIHPHPIRHRHHRRKQDGIGDLLSSVFRPHPR
jgi:hypothetical protein